MLDHGFLLLCESENRRSSYMDYANPSSRGPGEVRLHDDVMFYIWDTLNWIPTFNPSTGAQQMGLNLQGVTVIDRSGATKAATLFRLWAALFAEGPEPLVLTGSFEYIEGQDPAQGHLQRLIFDRALIVRAFQRLAEYADRVSTGGFYILHLGI